MSLEETTLLIRPEVSQGVPDLAANSHAVSRAHLVKDGYDALAATRKAWTSTAAEPASVGRGSPLTFTPIPVVASAARTSSYHALVEWEGYVLAIDRDVFTARLIDLTSGDTVPEEQGELPLDDLTSEERAALRPGTAFRFTIGYEKTPGGQRKRVSRIIMRQFPKWTRQEIEESRAAGEARVHALRWD
jgi:hypothetical protein